jgi:hypothetical protein
MTKTFLSYLERERQRIEQELGSANAKGANPSEITRLTQLRNIVDEQLALWSVEFSTDRLAA